METLLRDLRYGFRMLVRTPAVSSVAVLALALGIGANSAIFSVVYAVLLRPLPVREPGRLVAVHAYNARLNIPPIPPGYSVYGQWQTRAQSFESMAAAWTGIAEFALDREAEKLPFWRITAGFLPMLGVQPALGRAFTPAEDKPGSPNLALISDDLWRRRFGTASDVAGKTFKLDEQTYTVIGVMPRGFHLDGKPADVYAAIARDPAGKGYLPVNVYGRLKHGTTAGQAQAEMDAVAKSLDRTGFGWKAKVWDLRQSLVRDLRLSLLVLLGAVGLVLLIACANIASLLLARSSARQREIAIRAAMGAPKGRLVRQFLTESLLLGLLGGAAGLVLARWSMRLVPLLDSERLPNILLNTRIDPAVLGFTLLISLATGVIFGVAPAFSAVPTQVQARLQEGGRSGETRRRKRLWAALVVSETAFALMLMIGATLLMSSFLYLRDTAPGFRVDGIITVPVTAPKGQEPVALYEQVLERVRAIPGVTAATLASTLPLDGNFQAMSVPLEGQKYSSPRELPILWHRAVEDDYFRTLEIPLRRGRTFNRQDRDGGTRTVIINETVARRFWPGQDPLGKHLGSGGREWFEIVGVTADDRFQDVTKEGLFEVFFPYRQAPPPSVSIAVRAGRNPMRVAPSVARAVAAVTGSGSPPAVKELQEIAVDRIVSKRLTSGLLAVFAGLALMLAAIGIYGVLSFTVSLRTHEIGVRMALGAPRESVLRLIVGQAAGLAGTGILIGLGGALAVSRVLKTMLYGISSTDPIVFGGVSAALLAVAVFAAYIPARRASKLDPLAALRYE